MIFHSIFLHAYFEICVRAETSSRSKIFVWFPYLEQRAVFFGPTGTQMLKNTTPLRARTKVCRTTTCGAVTRDAKCNRGVEYYNFRFVDYILRRRRRGRVEKRTVAGSPVVWTRGGIVIVAIRFHTALHGQGHAGDLDRARARAHGPHSHARLFSTSFRFHVMFSPRLSVILHEPHSLVGRPPRGYTSKSVYDFGHRFSCSKSARGRFLMTFR